MEIVTLKQKLVCPYCGAKQEYKAKDYFVYGSTISHGIQCHNCDKEFNARVDGDKVYTYSNLITLV